MNNALQTEYAVMEQFYSIQGEGYHTGTAAYFIRLGGCDVGCVWCDVKESWNADAHPKTTVADLINEALLHGCKNIVITGGEPTMYDLEPLTKALKANGFDIWLETSGAYPLSGVFDWVCVSPKKFKAPLQEVLAAANELKVVVYHKSDIAWAEEHAKWVSKDCMLFLQPEWDKREQVMPQIVGHISKNPNWRVSLQTHKYLAIR